MIPFLLLTTIAAFTGFGIWGLMRSYRKQVERQLELDACVGKKAMELKSLLHTLTQSNTRMKYARISMIGAIFVPEVIEIIEAELEFELALQEGLRLKWIAEGGAAFLKRSCSGDSGLHAVPVRYPLLDWTRPPPDPIGPQPFQWKQEKPKFDLLFVALPLRSGAQVEGDPGENKWTARWTDFY